VIDEDFAGRIAILILCYNEGQTIGKLVRDFRSALPGGVVFVYDNNSKDDTLEGAREAGRLYGRGDNGAKQASSDKCSLTLMLTFTCWSMAVISTIAVLLLSLF
jgi:GT2 family glycosyltransferase